MKLVVKCIVWSAVVALIILIFYFAIWLVSRGIGSLFMGVNDTVKATSITAIVTVITFLVGRNFEQNRDRKLKVNAEKIAIYKKFFDFYFRVFSHEKMHGTSMPEADIVTEILEFQKDVVFWGSDQVVKRYLDFKDSLTVFSAGGNPIDEEENAKRWAEIMNAVAKLLVAMRRDIGYSFTAFSAKDLARLQLASDPETQKIYKYL